jgi:hypothetical protein
MAAGGVVFDGPPAILFARPDVLRRCGLRRPPVADAFSRARRRRADIPPAISLPAVRSALSRAAGR